MTWQTPDSLPWKKVLTAGEYYDFEKGTPLLVQTTDRIGEAVPKYLWQWPDGDDEESYFLSPHWANDSCSCCWDAIGEEIQFWQPLPERKEA